MHVAFATAIVMALTCPAVADPLDKIAELAALAKSGEPAVADQLLGATETSLKKRGYEASTGSLDFGDGIVAWPSLSSSQLVTEVSLYFHSDFSNTVALLEKQWGKHKLGEVSNRVAIWWWNRPRVRIEVKSETSSNDVHLSLSSYQPFDSVDFKRLLALNGSRVAAIGKTLGVSPDTSYTLEGETAWFTLGYTEFGDLGLKGEIDGDRVTNVRLVFACPSYAMNTLKARVRKRISKARLTNADGDFLEVR